MALKIGLEFALAVTIVLPQLRQISLVHPWHGGAIAGRINSCIQEGDLATEKRRPLEKPRPVLIVAIFLDEAVDCVQVCGLL
jgi:hypothetical protein